MKLGLLGTGYVGLVTGACLSDFGHHVICLDKNEKKISSLKKGVIPIYEPGLGSLIKKNVEAGRLEFGTDLTLYISKLDVIFLAVGTPTRRADGQADLESLLSAIKEVSDLSPKGKVIVIKSTVPVGTNKKVVQLLKRTKNKAVFDIVSNPEFLREGSAIDDFMKPDRVVVGTKSKRAKKIMTDIYKPLYLRDFPILFTDPESAEMIKYSSNAFLATKISFINEVASLCEKTGADVKEVSKGMGLDKRIGNKFLHAGPGYGGSCFPKDTIAFTNTGKLFGAPQNIVETVIKVNSQVKQRMVDKILSIFEGSVENKIICFFGVTFKPNTDDVREAPSLAIIPKLQGPKTEIRIVDPKGKNEGKNLLRKVNWYDNPYDAANGSDLIVILTEWNEFRALNLSRLSESMRSANMADLRNIYTKMEALNSGFKLYECVGRESSKKTTSFNYL